MSNEEAALFANDRFYTAFSTRDTKAMDTLWDDDQVFCVHPGWQPLSGREEVLTSWHAILGEETAPDIRCRTPRAAIIGDTAIVICIEDLGGSYLCATNIFRWDGSDWKMIHHHAGPVHMQEADLPEEPDVSVN